MVSLSTTFWFFVTATIRLKGETSTERAIHDMRGAGAADFRAVRPLSSRYLGGEATQEYRADAPKAATPPTNRPSSALKSTGHLLIHDDLVAPDSSELRDASPKPITPLPSRQSPSRLSGRFQVLDNGSREEFPPMSPRLSNPSPLAQQYSARLQPQDIETPASTKQESPARDASGSSRPSSAARRSGRLQVHDDTMSTSTQEIPAVSPSRSRPSSPTREQNDHHQRPPPSRNIPLSPIRQLSDRIKLHDDGALGIRQEMPSKQTMPALPTRQPSDRLQIHGDGAVSTKRNSSAGLTKEPLPMAPGAIDTQEPESQGIKHTHDHHDDTHPSQSNLEHTSKIPDIPSTTATDEAILTPTSRFVPLQSQWTYGQRIFGRYKKTPYFYSGNIATYLGAGMFMVVFDDGTLDYRVRREDIMLREQLPPQSPTPSPQKRKQRRQSDHQGQDESDNSKSRESLRLDSFSGLETGDKAKPSTGATSRRNSQQKQQDENGDENRLDPAAVPEHYLLPLHHVMVDFSVAPPREMVLSFDDGGSYDGGSYSCNASNAEKETWRLFLEDETLTMKRLECGVGYEDDSTQVSDSDESSEEDMSMTPWQQMTQTFGMGKANRAQRTNGRRSSISSVSQVDRLSMTHKGMKQIIPTPKSLKQIIADYFLRGNKKVQPSKLTDELALEEHVRMMEAKLNSMRSVQCNSGAPPSALVHRGDSDSLRVVYERGPDGVRAYGTVTKQVEDGGYAVVTEDEQSISVEMVPKDKVDFLPSVAELEQQLTDLERTQRMLFAGQKVQVSLYPGSRFCGRGMITLEREYQTRFHVLLANRIRLVNVPADKISPLREKKKTAVTITEDQFLVCNKVKVYIGDQIYVKCSTGNGDLDSSDEDEKLGLLNGVYSNRTAAVDFADGSTGYEVPPQIIFKCKRVSVPADQDVRSLKNAVLMQASVAANGGAKGNLPVLEEGYQVKADHPRKAAVESCIVIKAHHSSACDLRFSDGTIAFEVFPSQMILDSVEQQRTHTKTSSSLATNDSYSRPRPTPAYVVGDYVLAWSSRFGRYCSAKVLAKAAQDPTTGPGSISGSEGPTSSAMHGIAMPTSVPATQYTLVFDYGEYKTQMPADKVTRLDDTTALLHTQRLTNYSIDTIGFELSRVNFTVGEAVMARVHGSARYFNGIVEAVNEKERICAVCFDSSERDIAVPFSAMFTVDMRSRFTGRSSSTKKAGSGGSSNSEAASRARFLARSHVTEDTTTSSEVPTRPRRHSSGSVGNVLRSMDNFFRGSRPKPSLEPRRASHMITEIGARFRSPER